MFKKYFIFILVLAYLSVALFAANDKAVANSADPAELNHEFLKKKIQDSLGLEVQKVQKTPVPGIALLMTSQGIFYASYNGDYFIQGKVYSVGADSVTDIGEESLAAMRLEGVEKFANDMITYPAKNEKYVVTAFTDITCGYCRKMHKQMADYNARGITFRYLAYPRSGVKDRSGNLTKGFKDLRSVWCSEDPAKAMTAAKNERGIPYRVCDKPIEAQLNFGRQVGVNGTPALVLSNGMMVPGYQPPAQLEKMLKNM